MCKPGLSPKPGFEVGDGRTSLQKVLIREMQKFEYN